MNRYNYYEKVISENLKKILLFQDSNSGSFFYPNWKQDVNYVNTRWQEAVLVLALNYKPMFKNKILSAIDYSFKIQNTNGSFSQNYKGESSYPATAFLLNALCESLIVLEGKITLKEEWLKKLRKASFFVSKNSDKERTNIEAVASLALYKSSKLLNDSKIYEISKKKLNFVLNSQTKDGFFPEKGKMDLSYNSIVLQVLSEFHQQESRDEYLSVAKDYISLLLEFINPDGTFGGSYNSRTVGWLDLAGLEYFADFIPEAEFILGRIYDAYLKRKIEINHTPDDRHICTDTFRLIKAKNNYKKRKSTFSNYKKINTSLKSGLKIIRKKRYIAVTNINQNQLFSLWTIYGLFSLGDKVLMRKKKLSKIEKILCNLKLHKYVSKSFYFIKSFTIRKARRIDFQEDKIIFKNLRTIVLSDLKTKKINVYGKDLYIDRLGEISVLNSSFFSNASLNYDKYTGKNIKIEIK